MLMVWQIRAKRLAKLGGQGGSSTPPSAPNGAESSNQPSPSPQTGDRPEPPASTQENPFSRLTTQKEPEKKTEKKTEPAKFTVKPRPTSPAKRDSTGTARPEPRTRDRPTESLEVWQDRTLRQICRVTLRSEELKDSHGNKLVFLASTKDDLEQAGRPLLLDVEMVDGILTEAAGQAPGGKIFEYFLQCFKRTARTLRGMRSTEGDDPKQSILRETRRLSMSYAIFAVTMPEMFNETAPVSNALVDHLLAQDPEGDHGICTDFLTEAAARFDEDESIKDAIVAATEELSRRLGQQSMLYDYQNSVTAMRSLIRFPKIVDAITQSPLWASTDTEAQDIEMTTILGPFFRISPMQQEVANNYFTAGTKDKGFIANAQNAIRMTLRTHQQQLFEIANGIVRTGPAQRERMLNWFALCVNKNHKKRAMRVDYKTVSSDGFMVNVTNTLDRLCEPFLDSTFSKVDRIDVDYLRRSPRVDITDETKTNADQKASDEFYEQKADGTNNFISEVFFLTVAAHHYGTEAAQTRISTMRKSVKRYEQDMEAFKAERPKYEHVSILSSHMTDAR